MSRGSPALLVVVLLGACARTVSVSSPTPYVARANVLQLRSGERIEVERVERQTPDTVVVTEGGRSRRLRLIDVQSVTVQDRPMGVAVGGLAGGAVGAVVGGAIGVHQVDKSCGDLEDEDVAGGILCPGLYVGGAVAGGILGTLLGAAVGAGLGALSGYRRVYQRSPSLELMPTPSGIGALWTFEF